ncbi:hypothetical protein [Sandaracinus amylolyticus]|uniref:hypothetical protein n=1 Tax=Sandaracinus amylolyticus TaxID=927083 RepID=UPI001F198813|nr:hypothetical protein [Sandaracinus amylolyticus]UJR82378.1 Hypothetical protein I5071_44430 [Sandaracinus amylolyticus]
MTRSIPTLVVLALVASACCFSGTTDATTTTSTDPPPASGDTRASCDIVATLSTCRDLGPSAFALGEDFARGLCTGTYTSGGTCPTESRVGSCDEGGGQIRRYYSTGGLPYTLETAQQDCQLMPGATFTAS